MFSIIADLYWAKTCEIPVTRTHTHTHIPQRYQSADIGGFHDFITDLGRLAWCLQSSLSIPETNVKLT